MKKNTLIYLAIAAGIGYYFYSGAKKNKGKNESESVEPIEPADNEAPRPSERRLPELPKQLPMYSYNADTTIKPVAITLDTLRNSIFTPTAPKAFSLRVPTKAKKQAATKKQAKKKKLGDLGASYLYV
jgi:hypothetical protein